MKLTSTSFSNFETIPSKHTAEGEDISPPLMWESIPEGTRSLALICEDPDAPHGTWDHWILYNIPPDMSVFAEAITELPRGIQSCLNSWNKLGYGGPNPPSGNHRYFFILYALDTVFQLPPESNKASLLKAMNGHILEEATLVGRYELKNPRC